MLRKSDKAVYLADEDEILGYLKDTKDNLTLDFCLLSKRWQRKEFYYL